MMNENILNLVKLHKNFLPIVSNDADNLYVALLDNYIKDNKVKNIALTGGYGSGKSSIIDTFINKHYEYNPCKVSLAKYNNKNEADEKLFYENIYEEIIKQIYLNIPEEKVKRSNFSYLYKKFITLDKIIFSFIFVPIVVLLIKRYLNFQLNFPNEIVYWIKLIYLIFVFISLILLVYSVIDKKLAVDSVKFSNISLAFNLHNNNSNPLDKFLSEIIYLFRKSDIKVVFFEDLDRFNDVNIFVELKELNKSVNLALKSCGKTVSFVYAIKDDLFENSYDRFKFFDACVSVVPYSSLYNTYDLLIESFSPICDACAINIKNEVLNTISFFIHEYRAVIAIANDFIIYYNRILLIAPNIKLVPENLLYLLAYKNLFPIDFAKTYKHYSIIDRVILNLKNTNENKFETLNELFEHCNDNIDNRKPILEKIKDDFRNDIESKYEDNLIDFITQGIFEGYINDSFGNYISYIYNTSISENDYNFITFVKDNNNTIILDRNYELDSPQVIIDRLHSSDFLKDKILNFSLFDYIAATNVLYGNEKILKIMKALLESIDRGDSFVNICIYKIPMFDSLMKSIFIDKTTSVNYFLASTKHGHQYIKVINLILSNSDTNILNEINNKLGENNTSLKKIIESIENKEVFFNILDDNIIKIIKDFQIKFNIIEQNCLTEDVLQYIINNNCYYINKENLMFVYRHIQNDNMNDEEMLSFSALSNTKVIYNYINSSKENFDIYFDTVWSNRLNFDENDESFNEILQHVLIDPIRYQKFIDNVDIKYKNITNIHNSTVINKLIELNKIELNKANLIVLCSNYKSETLVKFINLNIEEIKKINLNTTDCANINEYIYNSFYDNDEKLVFLYNNANSFTVQTVMNNLKVDDANLLNEFETKEEIYINEKSMIFANILEKINHIKVSNDGRRTAFMKIRKL